MNINDISSLSYKAHGLEGESFSLRNDECVTIYKEPPSGQRKWFAVQLRLLTMPEDAGVTIKFSGDPIKHAELVACEMMGEKVGWKWLSLSPMTKETIHEMLFSSSCNFDEWYYIEVEHIFYRDHATAPQPVAV